LRAEMAKYPNAEFVWVQDEPENQGAWPFLALEAIGRALPPLRVISRPASASPATGSSKRSNDELRLILDRSFE
jgi:2-oxoglutarate decarboxylase